jgi:hypothetical protein
MKNIRLVTSDVAPDARVILTHLFEPHRVKSMCDFHTPLKKTLSKNVIGPSIKRIRVSTEPKVSQQDLAGRLAAIGVQIDRSAIARLERGDRFIRDFEIIGIAAALRVPLGQLFPK